MFQVPISAPTASRMKIAPTTVARPFCPDCAIASQGWPFLRMTAIADIEARIIATCIGPSTAAMPNSATEVPTSTTSTTSGSAASK
ncbi:hypothetical protein ABKA19_00375 [Pseudoxanthomonas sp. Soil82]